MKHKVIGLLFCFVSIFTKTASCQDILSTNYNNTFSPVICASSRDDWAKCNCNGGTWPANTKAPFEWQRIGDDKIFGLSGTVMYQAPAGSDFPLSHVFGYNPSTAQTKLLTDWESYIVVDPSYVNLLGKGNNPKDANGNRFDNEFTTAINNTLNAIKTLHGIDRRYASIEFGVMGLEVEAGLIPNEYRSVQGDRTAVFGDLIADCGHDEDGFHTEIHPPLMLVNARSFNGTNPFNAQQKVPDSVINVTFASIISRPYKITQYYNGGKTFLDAAAKEMGEATAAAAGSAATTLGTAPFYQLKMNADIADKPFHGLLLMVFDVYPQKPRANPLDVLWYQYHFTVRNGVAVRMVKSNDHITVFVDMNDLNYNSANNLLIKHTRNIKQDDFKNMGYDNIFAGVFLTSNIVPGLPVILGQGVQSTAYESPIPHSNFDLNIFPSQPGIFADISDDQPFPIYGWITVGWRKPSFLVIHNECELHPTPLTSSVNGVSNVNEVNYFPNNLDKSQIVTVNNPTNSPIQLGKITKAGTNPDEFILQVQPPIKLLFRNGKVIGSQPPENCSNTILQPHGSCSFRVAMLPNSTGLNYKATINVPALINGAAVCPLNIIIQQLNGVN